MPKLELWQQEVSVDSGKLTNKSIKMETTPTKTAQTNPIVDKPTCWSRYQSIVLPLIVVCGWRKWGPTVTVSIRTQRTRCHGYSLFCLALVGWAIVLLSKCSGCHPMDYDTKITKSGPKSRLLGQTSQFLVQCCLKQCRWLQFEFILISVNVEMHNFT